MAFICHKCLKALAFKLRIGRQAQPATASSDRAEALASRVRSVPLRAIVYLEKWTGRGNLTEREITSPSLPFRERIRLI